MPIIVQEHTNEVVKNYDSTLKAHTVWDVMTETDKIACAVLVDGKYVERISHAAKMLTWLPNFRPTGFYSDMWPHKKGFWQLVPEPQLEGRLGLFHFMQRTSRT